MVNLQPTFAKTTEGSPRFAYSGEAAASTTKAKHPRNMLQGIRRRGIRQVTYETLSVKREGNFSVWGDWRGTNEERHRLAHRIHERFYP